MKIAAIWLRVNVDANRPMPVATTLKTSTAAASVKKLPLIRTPNATSASTTISRKFSMASIT